MFHTVTVYALGYFFIPINPLMAAMSYFLFIFLNLVRSSYIELQNIEIKLLGEIVKATPPETHNKIKFLNAKARMIFLLE